MPTIAPERAEEIVRHWRADLATDLDSPAGPLFTGGRYAEADLLPTAAFSGRCGTECSASVKYHCC